MISLHENILGNVATTGVILDSFSICETENVNVEHLLFDDRLCHNHPTTDHPHANTVSLSKPWISDQRK